MKNRTIHYIRATVAVGSFLALLFAGVPLVDEYFEHRAAEQAVRRMQDEVVGLERISHMGARERSRRAERLAALDQRATTAASVSQARDLFVELAREAGCHVRTINASDPETRRWTGKEDNPLVTAVNRRPAWPARITYNENQPHRRRYIGGGSRVQPANCQPTNVIDNGLCGLPADRSDR